MILAAIVVVIFPMELRSQTPPVNLTLRGQWPGFRSGTANCIVTEGHYAYVGLGSSDLLILDIVDPAAPLVIGRCDNVGASGLCVINHFAYLAVAGGSGGLTVVDCSSPAQPIVTAKLETGFGYACHGAGNLVCLVGQDVSQTQSSLHVFDVTDPAHPQRLGNCSLPAAPSDVYLAGTHAYVADGTAGLLVIDLSNPAEPKLVGTCVTGGGAGGVQVVGTTAYVTGDAGLLVIDVSQPTLPVPLGALATTYALGRLQVVGGYAYAAANQEGMQVVDVGNPAEPVLIGRWPTSASAWGVGLAGDYACVTDWWGGVQVIDVRIPSSPVRVGGCLTSYAVPRVHLANGRAYALTTYVPDRPDQRRSRFQVLDVGNLARPLLRGECELSPLVPDFGAGVQVVGNYAYVAAQQGGLQVIDVGNPAAPATVAQYFPEGECQYYPDGKWGALDVHLEGSRAYVVVQCFDSGSARLEVVDIGDPLHPIFLGSCYRPEELNVIIKPSAPWGHVEVVAPCAYMTDYRYGLHVIDVSDPANPERLGGFDATGGEFPSRIYAFGVGVRGNCAYTTDQRHDRLQIINVSEPSRPVAAGGIGTGNLGPGTFVQVVDRYAYVSAGGLNVFDLTNPARPALAGRYAMDWAYGNSFSVAANTAVVVGPLGLAVLDIELPGTLKLNPPVLSANSLTLSWNGGAGIKLQKTSSLTNPDWQEVAGSDGASQLELPRDEAAAFFRLIQP